MTNETHEKVLDLFIGYYKHQDLRYSTFKEFLYESNSNKELTDNEMIEIEKIIHDSNLDISGKNDYKSRLRLLVK